MQGVRQDGVLGGAAHGGRGRVSQELLPMQPLQRDTQGMALSLIWNLVVVGEGTSDLLVPGRVLRALCRGLGVAEGG